MRILWIPHAGWHIPQRAHLFCRQLAQHHEIHVTDYGAEFNNLWDYFSKDYLRTFSSRTYMDGAISVHVIPRITPAIFSASLRNLNRSILTHFTQRIIAEHQIEAVVSTYLAHPPKVPRLIFDLFDENVAGWRSLGHEQFANEIEAIENDYLDNADAIIAASSVLANKARKRKTSKPIYVIPNGVNLETFNAPNGRNFRQSLSVKGRLVGTVANFSKRDEVGLMLETAKRLVDTNITFLLAGRGTALKWAKERVEREQITNVILYGVVPSEQLPDVIHALDVGICPYQKSVMDDARSPMRLIQFAALGLPTVCTALEEVCQMAFPNVIPVNPEPQEFAQGILKALQMPRQKPPQINQYDVHLLTHQYESIIQGV